MLRRVIAVLSSLALIGAIACERGGEEPPLPTATPSPTPTEATTEGLTDTGPWMARPTWEYETDRATIVGSAIPDNLVIDCSSGQLEASIDLDTDNEAPALPGVGQRSVRVVWFVDEGPGVVDEWGRTEDGTTLLADGPRLPGLFARSLLDAEYVHIAAFAGGAFRPFTFWLPDDLQTSWLNCVGR